MSTVIRHDVGPDVIRNDASMIPSRISLPRMAGRPKNSVTTKPPGTCSFCLFTHFVIGSVFCTWVARNAPMKSFAAAAVTHVRSVSSSIASHSGPVLSLGNGLGKPRAAKIRTQVLSQIILHCPPTTLVIDDMRFVRVFQDFATHNHEPHCFVQSIYHTGYIQHLILSPF